MAYDVKTPILKRVSDGLETIFNQALGGGADREQGTLAIQAGSKITRAVEVDLKARLARPKLERIEADDIDGGAAENARAA